MRAAAVVLVLIFGSAVILWYGNTVNTLVLGGLIGGLAALLLSIPITLLLFTYFSHRQNTYLDDEAEETVSLARSSYYEVPVEVYAVEEYLLPAEEAWSEDGYRSQYQPRYLPVPVYAPVPPQPRQQMQEQLPRLTDTAYRHRAIDMGARRRPDQTPEQQYAPGRKTYYPGLSGYQAHSQRGHLQNAALRSARQEAIQRYSSDMEMHPRNTSKRLPVVRPERGMMMEQPPNARPLRSSQHLPPQAPNHYRPRPTVESSSALPPDARRALPPARSEYSYGDSTQRMYTRTREPQTDRIGTHYPATSPMRQQRPTGSTMQTGQIGHMTRNQHVEPQRRNPDITTGNLRNPLVRRAPYMYEDDALRSELAQYIDSPPVRRSSRFEQYEDEGE